MQTLQEQRFNCKTCYPIKLQESCVQDRSPGWLEHSLPLSIARGKRKCSVKQTP